jgi:hypothetical protein
MSKARKLTVGVLLGASVCVAVGVSVWWFGGPSGPAQKLVGVWELMGTEFEDTIKAVVEKTDPEVGSRVGDRFRSTERLYLDRGGQFRHVQNLLGLTSTSEGTWQVTEANENTLSVKVHRKKSSLRDQKGDPGDR